MNNAQLPTRGIKNCRDSRLFKGCSPLQLFRQPDKKSPAIPYWPYCQTLAASAKNDTADNLLHEDRKKR